MRLWAVFTRGYHYDGGDTFHGVFSTKSKAEAFKATLDRGSEVDVEPVTLDVLDGSPPAWSVRIKREGRATVELCTSDETAIIEAGLKLHAPTKHEGGWISGVVLAQDERAAGAKAAAARRWCIEAGLWPEPPPPCSCERYQQHTGSLPDPDCRRHGGLRFKLLSDGQPSS
jgi:hypothetical protein